MCVNFRVCVCVCGSRVAREQREQQELLEGKTKKEGTRTNRAKTKERNLHDVMMGAGKNYTEKKIQKKKEIQDEKNKPRPVFKIGDRVRLMDGKAVGSIDTLEKGKAVVNYGMFTTNVSVDQLELVEAKK